MMQFECLEVGCYIARLPSCHPVCSTKKSLQAAQHTAAHVVTYRYRYATGTNSSCI